METIEKLRAMAFDVEQSATLNSQPITIVRRTVTEWVARAPNFESVHLSYNGDARDPRLNLWCISCYCVLESSIKPEHLVL